VSVPVLLIDDDVRLCDLIKTYLSGHGFSVSVAHTVKDGLRQLRSEEFDLVLLDIMLPDGDGLDVCKKIRNESPVPVIMLTARGADEDKIIGLELGADDYLAKPFNPRELVARIKAVLRRKGAPSDWSGNLHVIEYEEFQLNPQNQKLVIQGKTIELTSAEFRLLKILASNPGKVFTRERLMDLVSGRDFDGVDRSIDVHIARLRNKIEPDPRNPRWIKTVWGTGYRFQV
jgi:two-component system phosphate regulon response regulator OmpR